MKNPIAVFDSGIGGLTVLKVLATKFPYESFIYLGDTARLPYGTKSPETIVRYALGLTDVLQNFAPKAIIVACNTASAVALDSVAARAAPIPVIGMIGPAARAAHAATRNGHIAVLGTNATTRSHAYQAALHALDSGLTVTELPAQLLVALAEEGWHHHAAARDILRVYLAPFLERVPKPDTLILGCTHFPLFMGQIQELVGPDVAIIHCGDAAAQELAWQIPHPMQGEKGTTTFLVTDGLENFTRSAAQFLEGPIAADQVRIVDAVTLAA